MAWTPPADWTTGELVTAAKLNQQLRDNLKAAQATGDLKFKFAKTTDVEQVLDGGWLVLNGATVSRTTYPDLLAYFLSIDATLAATGGPGNGATTFTLPDARGRALTMDGGPSGNAAAQLGQNEGVAVASRQMKHNHTVGVSVGAHHHEVPALASGPTSGGSQSVQETTPTDGSTVQTDDVTVSVGVSVGPHTGAEPNDAAAFLVGGVWAIKF